RTDSGRWQKRARLSPEAAEAEIADVRAKAERSGRRSSGPPRPYGDNGLTAGQTANSVRGPLLWALLQQQSSDPVAAAEMLERCSKAIRASESAFLSTAAEFRRLRMQIKAEVQRIDDNRTAGARLGQDDVARLVTMMLDFHLGVANSVLTNSCPRSDAAPEMGCPPSSPS